MKIYKFDIVIVGAGAAGMMAAIEAGKRGRKVAVLEHNRQIGNKILISGGGRCNFTNINASPENYISSNPNFMKSAFAEYKPSDFIAMVERYGIKYYEKTLGQLFCRKSSREIINMLIAEANAAGIDIYTSVNISSVSRNSGLFEVKTDQGIYESEKCIIACGGLSFPKKGATDLGYRIAKQFGHTIIKTEPGLVPFTLSASDMEDLAEMSGISVNSNASLIYADKPKTKSKKVNFTEATLITHRGLSGPAMLQISSYWQMGDTLKLKLRPDLNWEQIFEENKSSSKETKNILSEYISGRLAEYITRRTDTNRPFSQLSQKAKATLLEELCSMKLIPSGTEGFPKAEVTLGGVDTRELDQKTMESKLCSGLYFVGEVVDVTGWLGGYNFQWAWASGYVCGKAV